MAKNHVTIFDSFLDIQVAPFLAQPAYYDMQGGPKTMLPYPLLESGA